MRRKARNGKGHRADHQVKAGHENALVALQSEAAESSKKAISCHLEQTPILAQPASRLLCLPGEIRNIIYAYVLKADGDLEFVHRSAYTRFGRPSTARKSYLRVRGDKTRENDEFNQLKFVCRGLYNETICFEFRLNTIFFDSVFLGGRGMIGAAELFSRFVNDCSHLKAACLSRVDLSHHTGQEFFGGGLKDLPVTFEGIEDFCRTYPKCTVRFFAFDFKTRFKTASEILHDGLHIKWAMRREIPNEFYETVDIDEGRWSRYWVKEESALEFNLPNFRVFPRQGTCVDDKFRKEVAAVPMMTTERYQTCVDTVEDWFENGI